MAPSASPYDPLKSVEAMWNGSLIRLADFFRDPANYGQNTQRILKETAKRYQDALDDCEVQILEAKWYLEHQLAASRARREQQAPTSTAIHNKRKLDDVDQDVSSQKEETKESPAKRVKVQHGGSENEQAGIDLETQFTKPHNDEVIGPVDSTHAQVTINTPELPLPVKEEAAGPEPELAAPERKAMNKPPDPIKISTEVPKEPAVTGDSFFPEAQKPSAQVSSASENQAYNFDSMFDDPENVADSNTANMNFDMDIGSFDDPMNGATKASGTHDDNQVSLEGLLPGLETYANQTGGDDFMNFPTTSADDGAGTQGPVQQQNNMFDLPDIGDTSFDDFLDGDNLDVGLADGGMGGEEYLNDDSMMNLGDLDDSFFNNT